jgi:TolA-binding protein
MSAFGVSEGESRSEGRTRARHRLIRLRRIIRLRRVIRLRRKLRLARRALVKSRGASASALGLLLLLFAASAGAAWGCGWGGFENSVRFGFSSESLRASLPPLPSETKGAFEDEEGVTAEQRVAEVNSLWDDAGSAVSSGQLDKARRLLGQYVERTAGPGCDDGWVTPLNCVERRGAAFDRLDALAALERGSSAVDVRSYLDARAAYDDWLARLKLTPEESHRLYSWIKQTPEQQESAARKEAERATGMREWESEVEARLDAPARDPNLADNVEYLRAVGIYRAGLQGNALEAFESVAARHPHGEKREAALYMAGRIALESSGVYLNGEAATAEEPCRDAECRDDGWTRASKNFKQLLEDYPRGRYAPDARGWLAYLDYRVGDTAAALVEYYRLLAGADASGRELAARSLRLVRRRADDADIEMVERELEDEPEAALAYAYHNVYNYAAGDFLRVPEVAAENPYRGDDDWFAKTEWDERQEGALRQRAERGELRRAAAFASRMIARHPRAQVGGAFLVRLACAQLELGETRPALAAARRALSAGLTGEERSRALWVEGVAEYDLKDYAASRKSLARVAEEFPRDVLANRARTLLATVAEDAGDLSGALEQYLALDYEADVSYFVDVLMTPDQLASFVARLSEVSPHRDELLYALGLRYMRAGRYAEARAALSRVRTTADDYNLSSGKYSYLSNDGENGRTHPKLNIRHYFYDEFGDGEDTARTDSRGDSSARDTRVYADWLLFDMKTLGDLERLQGEVDGAQGDEQKAEAMYQLASYFYEGELLFYNPAAWRGMRAEMIASLGESSYRAPAEAQIVWAYEQEHEGAARALSIYLEVARLYPRTRAARDSLYTSILCHQRLSEFNGYWREMYGRGMHAGVSLVTLSDLRRAYPQYRMPLVGDWKPSTRTVNGGPAWPAPPKPRRLTGMESARVKLRRAERRLAQAWELFGEVYEGRVRAWTVAALRWLMAASFAALVLFVFRRTRRARGFLYRRLARYLRPAHTSHVREVRAPKSSYAAHLARDVGMRDAACQTAHGLLRLALHERGRAALALNLFTHGLLTVLLWAVLWAMRKG